MENHTMYATFVGINAYPQSPLSGCIKDVLDVDLLLRELSAQQQDSLSYKPLYFLAPNNTDKLRIADYNNSLSIDLPFETPSFSNIKDKAFKHLEQAKDGDTCLFYYSGHGSQTDAPEVFWESKPDRQNETIVCVDSRDSSNPESRDLIDKELGYLIYQALKGKNVHCIVIMDCCHSGNNMRAMEDSGTSYRFVSSSKNNIPLEQYIGYNAPGSFYEVTNGKARIKIARYVHFAAARDSEKAQETKSGGLFTSKLIEVLRSGGTAKSYRELVQSLSISVRNRAEQQNPVAFAKVDEDLDLQFLGKGIVPYKPSFEVRYDFGINRWMMYGGAMHGVVPTADHARTLVKITGIANEIDVVEVHADYSLLDETGTASLDTSRDDYKAIIMRLANPVLNIGLSAGVLKEADLFSALKNAAEKETHLFFTIDFDHTKTDHDYLIQGTVENEYVLTRNESRVPLFKREKDAVSFLRNVDSVGKWVSTSELKNTNTSFQKDDFVFTVEKIEGESLNHQNLDTVSGEKITAQPGDEIVLSYKNNLQPAFRFNIALNPKSSLQSCFVNALYLESKFAIKNEFIKDDSNRLVKGGSPIDLNLLINNRFYKTIPLQLDPKYSLYNINEVIAFLKIFVANQPMDLQRFKQPNLELEDKPNVVLRGDDIGLAREADNLGEQSDWTVFTFKIRLVGSKKAQELEAGKPADFSAFTVDVPKSFKAIAFAATGDDQQRKLNKLNTRGIDVEADQVAAIIMPPVSIWGDALTDNSPFAKGLNSASDNGIQVLELYPATKGEILVIPEGEELVIKPKNLPVKTRDADEAEETIIPFGFDEASQLFFPIGYSDEEGNIHINQLPPETAGRIQGDDPPTRSLGGSVKLFFKKLFRKKQLNSLVLYAFGSNGTWEQLTDKPEEMKAKLAQKPNGKVLLLTHGLTGDTKHILGCLQEMPELPAQADFIITFDYENLATPMAKTAASLNNNLKTAGFGEPNMPTVTLIAHSQGGLVARWLVEQEGGSAYIKHLILVAAASGGSELAKLGISVFGMLTHALNVTGPIKYVITGLSFLLKSLELNPGKTLKETNPGSDLLIKLSTSPMSTGVRYSIIGGDTSLLKNGYDGDDYFLKKIAQALVKNVVYPGLTLKLYKDKPNDMAVTLESMRSIPGFDASTQMSIVASNHLAYFREKLCRKELLTFLQQPPV